MASEFALTELCSKRVNTSGEMSGAGKLRLDIFKTLVGNDHTTASHKFKDHFQFKNRCLLLFASNHIPELDNYMEVDPFVSRLVVFPFSHQKSRHEWENNLNEMFLGDLKNIFDFAIEGLRALVEDNYEFIETDAMVVAKENFVGSQNSFSLFAKKYLAFKHDKKVLSCDIERYYSAFCQKRDFTPLSVKKWSNQLTNFYGCLNYAGTKGSYDMKGRRARGYRGVQLADNVSELDEFIRIPDEDVIGGLFDED